MTSAEPVSQTSACSFSMPRLARTRPVCSTAARVHTVWIGDTLVANGMEAAAALDPLGGAADASAVRALMEWLLIYNGSIAFAVTGLFLGAAGYATFATGLLPRWTGWVAYAGAALCAACVPAMYGGPVNCSGLCNAGGWGPVIVANFPRGLVRRGQSFFFYPTISVRPARLCSFGDPSARVGRTVPTAAVETRGRCCQSPARFPASRWPSEPPGAGTGRRSWGRSASPRARRGAWAGPP